MAMVDTAALETSMKLASLDTLRGYSQDHYGMVEQGPPAEYVNKEEAKGYQVLREPAWNLGWFSFSFLIMMMLFSCSQ